MPQDAVAFPPCLDEAATHRAAGALAAALQPGDVVSLDGQLGAGKTRFVQGVARALGITAPVTSPTFTIHAVYPGALVLNHFDLYRLDALDQLDDIGYWEALEGDGASFVEWAANIPGSMPHDHLAIDIQVGPDGARHLQASAQGGRSQQLLDAWQAAMRAL